MQAAIISFSQTPQQFTSHNLAFQHFKKSNTGTITDALLNKSMETGILTDKQSGGFYSPTQFFAVINGSGTLNFIPKFTPSGIEIGNSQIFDNASNVGINIVTPSHKLHVLHGGTSGVRVQSTAGYSVVDIDAFNGDAGLRLQRAGVFNWLIRNNVANNNLDFFEFGGGSTRMTIQKNTGFVGINNSSPTTRLFINGDFSVTGIKAFTIDHPLDPEHKMLHHFAVESNEVLNSYSGNVVTNEKGKAEVKLPDYFEAINKDYRYQLTVIGSFARAIISREIKGNTFEVATDEPNIKISW
jgi:hypothetical protein